MDGRKERHRTQNPDQQLADATTYIAPSHLAAFCTPKRKEQEPAFVFSPVEFPAEVSAFLRAGKRMKRGKNE